MWFRTIRRSKKKWLSIYMYDNGRECGCDIDIENETTLVMTTDHQTARRTDFLDDDEVEVVVAAALRHWLSSLAVGVSADRVATDNQYYCLFEKGDREEAHARERDHCHRRRTPPRPRPRPTISPNPHRRRRRLPQSTEAEIPVYEAFPV
jgi:hypothetical protein